MGINSPNPEVPVKVVQPVLVDAVKPVEAVEAEKPLTFAESNLGKLVEGAKEAQKTPEELKKRQAARKKKAKGEKPDQKDLEEAADKLAEAGKKIEVKKDAKGEESVEMDLDLSKMRDFSGFTPDIKSFQIKVSAKQPDGSEKPMYEKLAFRRVKGGKIGYFYENEAGEVKELELPLEGMASITIGSGQFEKKKPGDVLIMIEKEMDEAALQLGKKAAGGIADDLAEGLTQVVASTSGSGGGHGASGLEPNPSPGDYSDGGSRRGPARSPSPGVSGIAPLPSPDQIKHRSLKMPEVVSGDLDTETETMSMEGVPDGLINFSKNPELMAKEPCFVFYLHGDGGSAQGSLKTISDRVNELRQAGVNAILVIPESSPGMSDNTKWNYMNEKCDEIFDFCFKKFHVDPGVGKINLISYSRGYQAVAAILKNSTHKKQIGTITMLDSTCPDSSHPANQLLADYIREGGNVKAFTGTKESPQKGVKDIEALLAENPGSGSWQHIPSEYGHGAMESKYLQDAFAFAGNVDLTAERPTEMEQSEMDAYLSKLMTSEAPGAFAGSCSSEAKPNHCEQFAGLLSSHFRGMLPGGLDSKSLIFDTPIAEEATAKLRGKAVADFVAEDFDRPGYTYFINRPDKYGDLIAPGTSGKLDKIADKRHWFVYLGRDAEGIQRFADNWGPSHTLDEVRTRYSEYGRVVLNVHDPLADYRDRMRVSMPAAPSAPAVPAAPSSSPSDSSEVLSTSLQKDIEEITEGMQGTVAVNIFDPATGKSLAELNENELLPAASLIKVPILFALHKAVKLGKVADSDIPELMEDARDMIVESGNSSTDRIIKYLGIEWINATIAELGLEDTKFGGLMLDKTTRKNWITAQDMSKIMTLAITQEPPAGWPSAMDLMHMKEPSIELKKMLPKDVKIAFKGGQISNQEHYAAVFTLGEKKLVMVVMVSDFDTRKRAKEGIRKIGKLVCDALGLKNT